MSLDRLLLVVWSVSSAALMLLVTWTTRTLVNDRRYFALACVGFAISALLLVTLGGMMFYAS